METERGGEEERETERDMKTGRKRETYLDIYAYIDRHRQRDGDMVRGETERFFEETREKL